MSLTNIMDGDNTQGIPVEPQTDGGDMPATDMPATADMSGEMVMPAEETAPEGDQPAA